MVQEANVSVESIDASSVPSVNLLAPLSLRGLSSIRACWLALAASESMGLSTSR